MADALARRITVPSPDADVAAGGPGPDADATETSQSWCVCGRGALLCCTAWSHFPQITLSEITRNACACECEPTAVRTASWQHRTKPAVHCPRASRPEHAWG
jgi:hypothetical protein